MRARQAAGLARLAWEAQPLEVALPQVELAEAHRQARSVAVHRARPIQQATVPLGREIQLSMLPA